MNGVNLEIGYIDLVDKKFTKLNKSEIEDAISFLKD